MKQIPSRTRRWFRLIFPVFLLLLLTPRIRAELLISTHGTITFAGYMHGIDRTQPRFPGYRAEFLSSMDIFRWDKLVLNGILGNTTIIANSPTDYFFLDRLRFVVAPGFRYEFPRWLIRGAFVRESINKIGLRNPDQTVWWNSFQLGVGSRGAYNLYLRQRIRGIHDEFANDWDAQVNIGFFATVNNKFLVAKNHDYQYEEFSLIRYHIGVYRKYAAFIGFSQHLWEKKDHSFEQKVSIALNIFRKGTANFAGLVYTYTLYDDFPLDNENHLGSLGLRIIF